MSASPEALIEAQKLTKYFGTFMAIKDISFSVPRGSITAFLGPNGAGKSTTLRILTGFLAPSSGRALIAGHDMAEERIAGSEKLGYLSENGPLYPDMTPASYLRYAGSVRHLKGATLNQALERVAHDCQLGEVWNKSIRQLSKGFRQRVGLAQALLHDPEVLIMDEPTAGLDPNQIVVVRDLVRNFARRNKAALLSTHILQEVEALADRVLLVHEGRLRFQGTPAELAGSEGMEARFRRPDARSGGMSNLSADAIGAIWRRQVSSLLGNPLGYVYILAFVLVAAGFMFIPDDFFKRNLADLGPLVDLMPWLLAVLLPALAMGSWALERELGTEEHLLTLPFERRRRRTREVAGRGDVLHAGAGLWAFQT